LGNKYDSPSDEKDVDDASDDDSLPSLCSDSDPDDMDQHEVDDLELHLTHGKIEDDDPIPQDETEVGDTDHDELWESLQVLADDALLQGASIEFVVKLRELLITYHNAFRLRLGQDPSADVPPLKTELKPDAKPKRIHARRYALINAQFLAAKMADMERLGLVKKNLASRWAIPPVIPPSDQDSWPMPNRSPGL
jgi:hypothetical protein